MDRTLHLTLGPILVIPSTLDFHSDILHVDLHFEILIDYLLPYY